MQAHTLHAYKKWRSVRVIAKYLDSDGAGERVEILEQLADAHHVPRVPVLPPDSLRMSSLANLWMMLVRL
jgi:hypothetical protein